MRTLDQVHEEWMRDPEYVQEYKKLKVCFPYFGSKDKVAADVWRAFGNIDYYTEPFFGSGAVLLNRPEVQGREIINDKDHFVVNFWRAIKYQPELVIEYIDWNCSELDLHVRHDWLVTTGIERLKKLEDDPLFCDPLIAGWWAWGRSCWVGREWCGKAYKNDKRTWRQKPDVLSYKGHYLDTIGNVIDYIEALHNRLLSVIVLYGNWSRAVTNSYIPKNKTCAVFLDPPYGELANRDNKLYAQESTSINQEVYKWCAENGDNLNYRIILCGQLGEYTLEGWSMKQWSRAGWRFNRSEKSDKIRHEEILWFSPGCIKD